MGSSTPQQTTQYSNSNSTSGPPQAIEGSLKSYAQDLQAYGAAHPNAPAYFPGNTVAQFSPQSNQAISALFNRGQNGSPLQTAGVGNAMDTLGGKYLDIANNPYFQGSLQAGFNVQNDNFNNNILPGLRSQFEGSGRTGSGADFDTAMRAVKDLGQTQSNAAATAAGNAYGQERGLQQQTLGMLPSFQAADYGNIAAMQQAGGMRDLKKQQNIDANVARYNYGQTAQPDWITSMAQRLQSIYPGGQTTGTGRSMSDGMPSTNPGASWLGGGLGLAGLGLQAFSAFSDERLKEDIKPVGKLHDGQNIYSYRFLGSPRTEIGLLAQEVEKRRPEAVHVDPATGFKKVHYGMATAPAGGLF